MQYRGIEIIQLKNRNLLFKLPRGGQVIIGCNKFLNEKELKRKADIFLKQNPIEDLE